MITNKKTLDNINTKKLAEEIYNLSVQLFYEVIRGDNRRIGHCGISGIAGNEKHIADGYCELKGAIGNLRQAETILKEKRNDENI